MNSSELRGSLSNIQDLARQLMKVEEFTHSWTFLIRSFTEKIKMEFEYWLFGISTEILNLEVVGNKPSNAMKLGPMATPNHSLNRTHCGVPPFGL